MRLKQVRCHKQRSIRAKGNIIGMSKNKEHPDSEDDGEDLFNQVLNGSANVMGGKGALDDIYLVKGTQHAADAIDFEDEDELAEDEEDSVAVDEGASGSGLGSGLGGADSSIKDDGEQAADDMFDDVFGEQNEDEGALQQKADNDFDDIFGEDDDSSNQRTLDSKNDTLFNDLGVTDDFDENAELNFEMFEDDIPDIDTNGNNANGMDTIATTGGDLKKRKLDEQSRRSAKKAKLEKIVDKLEKRLRRKNLSKFFPEYSKDKPYNNHSLFLPSARFFSFLRPPISQKPNPKALLPTKVTLELEPDQRKAFRSGKSHHRKNERKTGVTDIVPSDYSLIEELQRRDEYGFTNFKPVPFLSLDGTKDNFGSLSKDLIFSSTSWDDDLIINGGKEIADVEKIKKLQIRKELGVPDNLIDTKFQELEDGGEDGGEDEFEDDIFNGTISNYTTLKLDMNDPNLIFLPDKKQTETSTKSMAVIPTNEKMMESKFNISNDQEYELLRKNYNIKVRSQLSNLTIDHSIPAMRLQTPYYKVRLNKAECRSFHRPKFVVRPGALMNFSKLKLRKRRRIVVNHCKKFSRRLQT